MENNTKEITEKKMIEIMNSKFDEHQIRNNRKTEAAATVILQVIQQFFKKN